MALPHELPRPLAWLLGDRGPGTLRRATWLATIVSCMAERAAVERELEEIRAQLNWVRDYL
jgi:hypothetical protein